MSGVDVLRSAACSRRVPDRCPGALTLHEAADGSLARVRLPGGFVSGPVLAGLADVAARFSGSALELTSRGNVQLRAIAPADEVALGAELADLGLLPSPRHERVRNIIASPWAGLDGTGPDLLDLVTATDHALCARPALAELSGRFLFGLDGGRGDILALAPDVTAVRAGPDRWTVRPGTGTGPGTATVATGNPTVATGDVPEMMMNFAQAFLDECAHQDRAAWRIADLVDGPERVAARVSSPLLAAVVAPVTRGRQKRSPATEIVVPLGRLTPVQARALADLITDRPARVTPWRTVVLPGVRVSAEFVHALDLDVGVDSPWRGVTACAGRPGCAKALADVQSDARHEVLADRDRSALAGDTLARPVHWSGCERRCGHPRGPHTEVLAVPGDGGRSRYRITEVGGR